VVAVQLEETLAVLRIEILLRPVMVNDTPDIEPLVDIGRVSSSIFAHDMDTYASVFLSLEPVQSLPVGIGQVTPEDSRHAAAFRWNGGRIGLVDDGSSNPPIELGVMPMRRVADHFGKDIGKHEGSVTEEIGHG
jgi:hypothetical protein